MTYSARTTRAAANRRFIFADLTDDERIAKAKELGLPKFRVRQLANHYYGHFDADAGYFTDFPAGKTR